MLKSQILKRTQAFFIALSLVFALLVSLMLPVSAESVRRIFIAGDAISSGKGLSDRAGKSYGGLLAAELGIKSGNYMNVAVDSADSDALLDSLPVNRVYIEDADLIILSTGLDDIMPYIMGALETVIATKVSYSEFIKKASAADFAGRLNDAIDHTALFNTTTKFTLNLNDIILKIREYNPNATIVLLSLYNPLYGIDSVAGAKAVLDNVINPINSSIAAKAAEYGCHVADLSAAFTGSADKMTNLTSLDPSPNATGHRAIADLLKEFIATLPELPPETTPANTTEPDETTEPAGSSDSTAETTTSVDLGYEQNNSDMRIWIYIAIAVFVAAGGVMIVVFSVRRKK